MPVWLAFYFGLTLGGFLGILLSGLLAMAGDSPPGLLPAPKTRNPKPETCFPEDPMNLIALYLRDYNRLSRRDQARFWAYAAIILIPLAAILLASHGYGPSLERIMGW